MNQLMNFLTSPYRAAGHNFKPWRGVKAALFLCLVALAHMAHAQAPERITIAVNDGIAPYIFLPDDETPTFRGLDIDILTDVLESMDLKVSFVAVPPARLWRHMMSGEANGAMSYIGYKGDGGCISWPYRFWLNSAIVHPDSKIDPHELTPSMVATFPAAHKVLAGQLGPLADAVEQAIVVNNSLQAARGLYGKRYFLYVGDSIAVRFFYRQFMKPGDAMLKVHKIYTPGPQSVAFQDPALCTMFNAELAAFQATPRYLALLQRYELGPAFQQYTLEALAQYDGKGFSGE